MSKEKNSVEVPVVNPAAFPQQPVSPEGKPTAPIPGMTLRDYFAAKAMNGIIMNYESDEHFHPNEVWLSEVSFSIADAMLKARL